MFTLIITLIAIALVAALAIAAIFYGGSAWSQGNAKAEASALVTQAQQIAGANDMYAGIHGTLAVDGTSPTTDVPGSGVQALVSAGDLSVAPQVPSSVGGAWTLPPGMSPPNLPTVTLTNKMVCEEVNAEAAGSPTLTTPPTLPNGGEFGCFGSDPGPYTFYYMAD